MAASYDTVKEVLKVIREFVPDAGRRTDMFQRLLQVRGNASFAETVRRLATLGLQADADRESDAAAARRHFSSATRKLTELSAEEKVEFRHRAEEVLPPYSDIVRPNRKEG